MKCPARNAPELLLFERSGAADSYRRRLGGWRSRGRLEQVEDFLRLRVGRINGRLFARRGLLSQDKRFDFGKIGSQFGEVSHVSLLVAFQKIDDGS